MAKTDDKLERLQAAMSPREARRADRQARRAERRIRKGRGSPATMLTLAVAFIAVAIATGNNAFFIPGFILAALGASRLLQSALSPKAAAGQAKIGMGADIGVGAVIEPGAVVEMGADVKAGARVCAGAVVRMGATVHENAVIEAGAVVGYGSDVEAGAVVETGAVIGAGATVRQGSRVTAGTTVSAGATYANAAAATSTPAVKDERRGRIEAACARIEQEVSQLPDTFREHLGATAGTAGSLRETCLALLERERTLRRESSDDGLTFLDSEKAELEKRIAAASDAQVKRSLSSAVAAIEDQKKQRLQVKTYADRIDAEVTRMQWTLDGMAAQLVRLRTAGGDAAAPPSSEVMQTVHQLHEEIDAIADALEHVKQSEQPMLQPISEISSGDSVAPASGERTR